MKNMMIYEPAMCCSTGVCGVSYDPQLLRIATVLASLEKNGVKVTRYNLTGAPQEFVKNAKISELLAKDADVLPVTVVDGEVVLTKRYPTNDEFVSLLEVPESYLGEAKKVKVTPVAKKSGGCGCSDGKCC